MGNQTLTATSGRRSHVHISTQTYQLAQDCRGPLLSRFVHVYAPTRGILQAMLQLPDLVHERLRSNLHSNVTSRSPAQVQPMSLAMCNAIVWSSLLRTAEQLRHVLWTCSECKSSAEASNAFAATSRRQGAHCMHRLAALAMQLQYALQHSIADIRHLCTHCGRRLTCGSVMLLVGYAGVGLALIMQVAMQRLLVLGGAAL
jgi:hypothetical protein